MNRQKAQTFSNADPAWLAKEETKVERLKTALAWYANPATYAPPEGFTTPAKEDMGAYARKVLGIKECPCPACFTTGLAGMELGPPIAVCPSCGGTGVDPEDRENLCPGCAGQGRLVRACNACAGSGIWNQAQEESPVNGAFLILRPEEYAERTARARHGICFKCGGPCDQNAKWDEATKGFLCLDCQTILGEPGILPGQ